MTQSLAEYDLTPMTLSQWESVYPEQTHELVEGIPTMSPHELVDNRHAIARINRRIVTATHFDPLQDTDVLTVPGSTPTVRVPDLIVRATGSASHGPRYVEATQLLLVIEAVSRSTRETDLVHKRREYATAGIPTYLVVDLDNERLILFTDPTDGRYASVTTGRGVAIDLAGTAIEIAIDDLT